MIKNLKQLYAMAVCFVCSVIFIISIGVGLNAGLNYVAPRYMNYSYFSRFESNEKFLKSFEDQEKRFAELKALPVDQLSSEREEKKADFLENEKRNDISTLMKIAPWILTAMLFFFIHWILYTRIRQRD